MAVKQYHTHYLQPKASAPPSTFPQVAATSSGTANFTTSYPVTLPSGTGGRFLLLFERGNACTTTWPGGWTSLITNTVNDWAFEARYADGNTTAPTLTTSVTTIGAWRCIRITGEHPATAPEVSSVATATSTAPNSGVLDPTGWGTEDTLWLSVYSSAATAGPSGYPAGYAGASVSNSNGGTVAYATRGLNAGSEDPGAFTQTSAVWFAATFAVRPAPVTAATQTGAFLLFI